MTQLELEQAHSRLQAFVRDLCPTPSDGVTVLRTAYVYLHALGALALNVKPIAAEEDAVRHVRDEYLGAYNAVHQRAAPPALIMPSKGRH